MTDIQTNVESKSVIVQAEESVSPQLMLEKLQAVRSPDFDDDLNLWKLPNHFDFLLTIELNM